MNSPAKKVRTTESSAYVNVHTKVERNGSRTSGFRKMSLKFAKPMLVRQPWSISWPLGVRVRTLFVVGIDDTGLDIREGVGLRVVAERRLELERRREALGTDERVSAGGDDEPGELLVDPGELVARQDVVALRRSDGAVRDRDVRRGKRREPFLVSGVGLAAAFLDEEEREVPALVARGGHRVEGAVRRLRQRRLLDGLDRLLLREVVTRRPVGEGDVGVVDDRDQLEPDQEDGRRHEELRGTSPRTGRR